MVIITSYPYWNAESSWNTETSAGARTAGSALDTILSFEGQTVTGSWPISQGVNLMTLRGRPILLGWS